VPDGGRDRSPVLLRAGRVHLRGAHGLGGGPLGLLREGGEPRALRAERRGALGDDAQRWRLSQRLTGPHLHPPAPVPTRIGAGPFLTRGSKAAAGLLSFSSPKCSPASKP